MTTPRPPGTVLLVCGPAGYGKTWFLAEYGAALVDHDVPVAWLTSHPRDDAHAFWQGVVAALHRGLTGRWPAVTAALARMAAPEGPTDLSFVAELLTAVETDEETEVLLVLDDVHVLGEPDAVDALRLLVELAPPSLRLALGCRYEPAIGVHRLRLDGRLREVTSSELEFTSAEAQDFWELHGVPLDSDRNQRLLRRTEGWAAGLRLVAMAMAGDDPDSVVDSFAGDDRTVADYLAAEVLAGLHPDAREVLALTSIVDELTAGLAERLARRPGAGGLLHTLAQRNAFVDRLGRSGQWFRPHALLRDSLRADLDRRDTALVARQHGIAARWFAEQNRPDTALHHALAAGDPTLLVDLLHEHGLPLLLRGVQAPVEQAIGDVPASVAGSTTVLVHRALAALEKGDLARADAARAELGAQPVADADPRLEGLLMVTDLCRARLGLDTDGRERAWLDGVGRDDDPATAGGTTDNDVLAAALASRAALRLAAGDDVRAESDVDVALALARSQSYDYLALLCLALRSAISGARHHYPETASRAREAIEFAMRHGWARSARTAHAYALAGWTAHLALQPSPASRWSATAVEVIDRAIDIEADSTARTVEAVVAFDVPTGRRDALARLRAVSGRLDRHLVSPTLVATAAVQELRMCLALSQWRQAEDVVTGARQRLGDTGDVSLLHAQLLAARGRMRESRRRLLPVLDGTQPALVPTSVTSAWLLEARAAEHSGQHTAMAQALRAALGHASETTASRPFFDAGPALWPRLRELRGRAGTEEAFLAQVLSGIDVLRDWQRGPTEPTTAATDGARPTNGGTTGTNGGTTGTNGGTTGEWLTERELEILRELPSLLTITEIASGHGVSVNTVKTHIRTIYRKLDASSRREAVGVARHWGLL